ncbi:MAG: stage III sporulation protein AF [Firmicutes bacterium]|nr:stage III sporulation protein AF [Bacillota bacterium]
MSGITLWVKGIIAIIIFSSFAEHLLPGGEIKKYVRFAVGLIVIALMVKPLLGAKTLEIPNIAPGGQHDYAVFDYKDIYVQRLEQQVKNAIGVEKIKIIVNPENPVEIIYVVAAEKKEKIANYLEIPSDKVGD